MPTRDHHLCCCLWLTPTVFLPVQVQTYAWTVLHGPDSPEQVRSLDEEQHLRCSCGLLLHMLPAAVPASADEHASLAPAGAATSSSCHAWRPQARCTPGFHVP